MAYAVKRTYVKQKLGMHQPYGSMYFSMSSTKNFWNSPQDVLGETNVSAVLFSICEMP